MTDGLTNTGLVERGDPWAEVDPPVTDGHLPEEFWKKRAIFQHIRNAAHSRACSGDVAFYTTLARLSGMRSHRYAANTGVTGRTSLNIFAAVVGRSGMGKSTGSAVGRDLMSAEGVDFLDGLPIGTGEGIAEAFMGTEDEPTGDFYKGGPNKGDPVTKPVRRQMKHNAFFYVDEGQTIAQLAQRSGSTLAETLRRAAVGEALGQTNASEDRKRLILPNSYSLGMVVGFQPSTAVPLLADGSTGTPQRFLWCLADDPTIPDDPIDWPGQIERHVGLLRPPADIDITFPERIRRQLWRDRVMVNRDEIEVMELDSHAPGTKVKLAAMFALLDNPVRTAVSEEDWELAEMVWASSCAVRDTLVERARREAEAVRVAQEDAAVSVAVRIHDARTSADHNIERLAQGIKRNVAKAGVGGITWGTLRKKFESKDRPLLEKALALAVSRGWVVEDDDRICMAIEDLGGGGGGGDQAE